MEFLLHDWQSLIAALRLWMAGGNPYGAYYGMNGRLYEAGYFAYPPPALLLGAPLAFLPWQLSGALLMVLTVIGFERSARGVAGRMALPWLILWLPLFQGLWLGQTTLPALLALLAAAGAAQAGRQRAAGLLLALALLKPQAVGLPAAWLLICALRERRWGLPLSFAAASTALWGGAALVAGPQIYLTWIDGLRGYAGSMLNQPLLFPPLGPLMAGLAALLWWRHGRGDTFGLALLLNTLLYPLQVVYVASALALVVIRWRPGWAWYPLPLSWACAVILAPPVRTPLSVALLVQAICATALCAGLLPRWLPRLRPRPAPDMLQ